MDSDEEYDEQYDWKIKQQKLLKQRKLFKKRFPFPFSESSDSSDEDDRVKKQNEMAEELGKDEGEERVDEEDM